MDLLFLHQICFSKENFLVDDLRYDILWAQFISTTAWKVSKYEVISCPYFPGKYRKIWSEYRKIRTRNNSVFRHFSRSVHLTVMIDIMDKVDNVRTWKEYNFNFCIQKLQLILERFSKQGETKIIFCSTGKTAKKKAKKKGAVVRQNKSNILHSKHRRKTCNSFKAVFLFPF